MKYERANQLQFWRFLAFLIIFQCHASQWAPFQIDNIRALLGVFFFVLLSGAMSSYALHQKAFRNDSKGILDHKIKSVIRAYPLYIITNCFTMAYLIPIDLVTSHSFKDLAKEFINFILTATMLQPWFLKTESFNATSWYVASVSWIGILSIPVHIFSEKKMGSKRPVILMSILALAGVLYTAIMTFGASYILKIDITTVPILYHPLVLLGLFISGMSLGFIAIILIDRASERKTKSSVFTMLEIILTVLWLSLLFYPSTNIGIFPVLSIVVDYFLILVFIFGRGKLSDLFRLSPLVHLGNITFETYLVHQIIIFAFCFRNGWSSFSRLGNLFALSLCMFVTLVISDFLHSMVGRRTMK